MSHLSSALRALGRGIRYVCIGLGAIVVSGGVLVWADNYQATTGAGTTFASKVISAVNYVQFLLCDATTGTSSCATVSGGALKVDNSAVTQPVSGTVTANLSSLNGAATATNQSTEITALQAIQTATAAIQTATAAIQTSSASTATNTGAAVPSGTARIGYVSDDPCTQLTKTNLAIATSGGTTQLVAPSGSTQVYVCSFSLIGAATAVVNLVGGTGATCTTGTPVAALGSTTAASGMSLAANGGLTFGNGGATVARTTTAGHGLCLIQSGTTALAGNITYIQQ